MWEGGGSLAFHPVPFTFHVEKGGDPDPPHPGARSHCCRCSLPGLTGFTAFRREGTERGHHKKDWLIVTLRAATIHAFML